MEDKFPDFGILTCCEKMIFDSDQFVSDRFDIGLFRALNPSGASRRNCFGLDLILFGACTKF